MNHVSQNPRFAELQSDVDRLNAALSKVEVRLAEIDAMRLAPGSPEILEDRQVAAALSFAETGSVVDAYVAGQNLEAERLALSSQREALRNAIAQRRAEQYRVIGELSIEYSAELQSEHKKIAGRMLEALYAIDKAQRDERELVARIEKAGLEARFPEWIAWPHVGTLAQVSESALWYRERELKRYTS